MLLQRDPDLLTDCVIALLAPEIQLSSSCSPALSFAAALQLSELGRVSTAVCLELGAVSYEPFSHRNHGRDFSAGEPNERLSLAASPSGCSRSSRYSPTAPIAFTMTKNNLHRLTAAEVVAQTAAGTLTVED